ncbi:MAG TPA: DUF448 domain-containing protein [Verrucomicrobiae bacterium]|nr:DUF448 domain-containing protein [Verrucomicrobiae bacterium]
MTKGKHAPERTCLGCGAREKQAIMIRLTATSDGGVIMEPIQGRGGYLHRREDCWKMFINRKSHFRAFRRETSRTARETLVRQLKARYGE